MKPGNVSVREDFENGSWEGPVFQTLGQKVLAVLVAIALILWAVM